MCVCIHTYIHIACMHSCMNTYVFIHTPKSYRCILLFWEARNMCYLASLVAQLVKNLPAMQETWIPSPGWEDPLEKKTATHSSILAWIITWTQSTTEWLSFTSLHKNNLGTCHNSNIWLVVQSASCVRLFATPWVAAHQASLSLSLTISQSLPKFILHKLLALVIYKWVGCSFNLPIRVILTSQHEWRLLHFKEPISSVVILHSTGQKC